jgi:hypothetical protein
MSTAETAYGHVTETLCEHVARVEAHLAGLLSQGKSPVAGLSLIAVDYNGTWNHPIHGEAITDFIHSALQLGVPVTLMVGNPYQEFEDPVASFLAEQGHMIAKPFSLGTFRPGMIVDDEKAFGRFAIGTFLPPDSRFFSYWPQLTAGQKREAFEPWLEFHQRLSFLQAPTAVQHAYAPMPS